jgi:uncharacterized coiled-coil DUF342 family protein
LHLQSKQIYFGQSKVKLKYTTMGFLPIIVALIGLILLFSIYTYNQIKPRKANINAVVNKIAEVSKNRKELILAYDTSHPGTEISDIADQLKKSSTDRFQSFNKEEGLTHAIDIAIDKLGDASLAERLKELNQHQEGLIQKLRDTSREYNTFISQAPQSSVATVFGFKPF